MSTKRSLFAASTSLDGPGKSGKEYVWTGGLPKFGKKGKEKLQTPNFKLQKSSKLQAPNPKPTPHLKAKEPGRVTGVFAKLKGLIRGGKASTKPSIPRFSPGPVQCELSLDNVKVMRNDLSDTDFELVAKPVASKKAAPAESMPAPVVTAAEPRPKIWNRVTTLLGAGQS